MLVLVQRVSDATLKVNGDLISTMDAGLVVYVCYEKGDVDKNEWLTEKILSLRIFEDDNEKLNKSVVDINGGIMLVPNFTLAGNCQKGTRPSFDNAMDYDEAKIYFTDLVAQFMARYSRVSAGVFGANMLINSWIDGPVNTIIK